MAMAGGVIQDRRTHQNRYNLLDFFLIDRQRERRQLRFGHCTERFSPVRWAAYAPRF